MENFYGGYNPYPYIYIQYSHDDAERVIPIIKALRAKNYNIVFDKNFDEEDRYRYLNVQQITQAAAAKKRERAISHIFQSESA